MAHSNRILALEFRISRTLFNKTYANHAAWQFEHGDHLLMRFSQVAALAEIEAAWETVRAGWHYVMYSRVAPAWLRQRFPRIIRRELTLSEPIIEGPRLRKPVFQDTIK